jgi:hypothetical protein
VADESTPDGPQDPFNSLAAGAAQVHEAYLTFLAAGFTEGQALYLAACVLAGGPKAAP